MSQDQSRQPSRAGTPAGSAAPGSAAPSRAATPMGQYIAQGSQTSRAPSVLGKAGRPPSVLGTRPQTPASALGYAALQSASRLQSRAEIRQSQAPSPLPGGSQISSRPNTSMSGSSSIFMPKHVRKVENPISNPLAALMQPGANAGSVLSSWLKALLGYGAQSHASARIWLCLPKFGHAGQNLVDQGRVPS